MPAPSQTDYVKIYFTLYERFEQEQKAGSHRGHPFDYETKVLILFFTMMMWSFSTMHRTNPKKSG
jgi:hypothetical protein